MRKRERSLEGEGKGDLVEKGGGFEGLGRDVEGSERFRRADVWKMVRACLGLL